MRTKKVIGKFKDETNSVPTPEFVALNPKCYSFNHLKKDATNKNTKRSNSVSKYVVHHQITHDNYMDTMNKNEQLSRDVVSLRSKDSYDKNDKAPEMFSKQFLRQDAIDKCNRLCAIRLYTVMFLI